MVNSSAFQNIPIPVGCLQDERLDGALSSSLTPSFPLTSSLRAIRRGEDLTLPTHLSRAVEQTVTKGSGKTVVAISGIRQSFLPKTLLSPCLAAWNQTDPRKGAEAEMLPPHTPNLPLTTRRM